MKKVIELIRVSTQAQAGDDRASIPAQKAINRKTAEVYGLTITKSVLLTDVSGTAVLRTPEMQELLQLIESEEMHGVVVREFSRVMRPDNFSDYILFQVFQDTKTLLYLPDGPLDLNSKSGKLVAGLRAIIAGNELSEFRERVFGAKESMRRAGKHVNGPITLPFGVGYSREQGFFYKPEAELVREAFRRLLSGETSYTVLAKPMSYSPQGLVEMLSNPIYTGWRVYTQKRNMATSARRYAVDGRQGDRTKIARSEDEIIRVQVISTPIVTEAEFAAAQEIIERKKKFHWRQRADTVHHFTYNGFLHCADCNSTIYGKNHQRKGGFYYVCRRRGFRIGDTGRCPTSYMRREQLEAKLDGMFSEQLTDMDFIKGLLKEIDVKSAESTSRGRIVRLESELVKLREKRSRVLDAFFEAVLTRVERDARLAELDEKVKFTEDLLLREAPVPQTITAPILLAAMAPLFDWEFMDREKKRRILSVTVPDIQVADYNIRGISITPPACGNNVSRCSAASLIATVNPERIFLPLNL